MNDNQPAHTDDSRALRALFQEIGPTLYFQTLCNKLHRAEPDAWPSSRVRAALDILVARGEVEEGALQLKA
jgi:hypothetical protein